ncbi:hypothetical protein WDW86_04480 [Bdellovibrionota bacterium FG-2]
MVFFDQVAVIYLTRIAAHREAIERYEYKFIKRGLPANYGAQMQGVSESDRAGFEKELNRCLQDMPHNVYCLIGKSSCLSKRGDLEGALTRLTQAYAIDSTNPELLLEFITVYPAKKMPREADLMQARFDRLTFHN